MLLRITIWKNIEYIHQIMLCIYSKLANRTKIKRQNIILGRTEYKNLKPQQKKNKEK